eukprot:2690524-Prymnesium_polylepis.2
MRSVLLRVPRSPARPRRCRCEVYGVTRIPHREGRQTVGLRRTDAARLVDSDTGREPSCAPLKIPCQTEVPVPRRSVFDLSVSGRPQ